MKRGGGTLVVLVAVCMLDGEQEWLSGLVFLSSLSSSRGLYPPKIL